MQKMSKQVVAIILCVVRVDWHDPEYACVTVASSDTYTYDEACEQIKKIIQTGTIHFYKKDEPEPEVCRVLSVNVTENTGETLFNFGQNNNALVGENFFY